MTTFKATATALDDTGSSAQLAASFTVQPRAVFGAAIGSLSAAGLTAPVGAWKQATGLPMAARHHFMQSTVPASYAVSPFAGEAGARKILVDFELAHDGSQAAAFDAFLGSCSQAGLAMDITLYHSPPTGKFTLPSAYFSAVEKYVPVITKHGYRHIFDLTGDQALAKGALPVWWPGDHVQVNAVGLEFYVQGFQGGQRLDTAASFCDAKGVPLGLTEMGADFGKFTEAQGLSHFSYCHDFFAGRIAAGDPVYDILTWNTGDTGFVVTNQPASWIAKYQDIAGLLSTT